MTTPKQLDPSDKHNMRFAAKLFAEQFPESKFREIFGTTLGIKLYGICYLDSFSTILNLRKQIIDGGLKLSKIDFKKVQKFKTRLQVQMGKTVRDPSRFPPITIEEIVDYFNNLK